MSDGAGSDYYTAADQQIREVHDALLDLKYLPFDPDHDRSRFGLGRSSSTRVPPHLAARPVVPDGRRRRRAAPSTPIPSSTTFAQMIDYKRPRSDAVIDENDDPEIAWQRWLQAWKPSSPRAGVRQSRTRPAHLDQYLDEIHGRRTSRPDLVPIDDTPSRSPVATADAQTETDAERRRRARASMTDPAPAVVDVATSPTRTVSRSPSIDEEIVIRSNDDCMDWESGSSQMHGSVSINDAVILSESTRLNGWRRSRSLSDPSDDLILAMILQMFAAALSRPSDESPPAVTVSEPVIADPDLVQVQLEVVDRHRDLPHVRLSIRDAHAPVPWVVYGADPVPVAVAAAPVQDTGTDPIIDDVIGDVSTPLSPRYRSCGRRSLVGTDRLRLSPARSLDAVEVVRVAGQRDGAVSDAARSLERYVETDLDATDHAEAFLIEPMIDDLIHDLIEILIIVTASPDHQTDVMVAVRVLGAPSGVCLGPIARRPMLVAPSPPSPNAADIDPAAIAGDCPDRLAEPETPSSGCGRDDDEDGDAHPHLGSSPRSYEIAYRGGWVSDRSDTTSSGSADDSDEDDDVLGPISAIPLSSSGEFALSHDPFSDGEIIYPCLRDLLSETGHLHLSSTHALDWSSSDDDSKSEG